MSTVEKCAAIDPENDHISVVRQCALIGLMRSNYYSRLQSTAVASKHNLALMRLIDEEYTRHPFYGSRKITRWLMDQNHQVNRKRVQRLMRLMGIESIAPKPFTSKGNKEHKKYPYLLGNMDITEPNQAWCTDITYIRMPGGFVYLTAVMDWYSRFVLSWEISITMEDDFCINAVESAIRRHGKPLVFNSDQGAQYTSKDFTGMLNGHGIEISMDGRGRWMDNVFIERLWRSVKYEEIYTKEYGSVRELIDALRYYFEFYNFERRHQSLDDQTPAEVYYGEQQLAKAA